MKKKYVVGFLFDESKKRVCLIRKNRPVWQQGYLNGVGGKVEDTDKYPVEAMRREFFEETGVNIKIWNYRGEVIGHDWEVTVFSAISNDIDMVSTITDEEIVVTDIKSLQNQMLVEGVDILIKLSLSKIGNFQLLY